jgi:3-hydroxyanthranilate 3,4-dioxygenase
MERTRETNVFAAGAEARACDEWPLVPAGVEPQVDISRSSVPEPFFNVFDHDTVIVAMVGYGQVDFHGANVLWEPLQPGDFVYVPAGIPARIVPAGELLTLRLTADARAAQGCAWFCEQCGDELFSFTWDAAAVTSQEGFLAATAAYQGEAARRECQRCSTRAPDLDLAGFRWGELAAARRGAEPALPVERLTSSIERSSKLPLRVNAFERLQTANVQLVTLFPYLDDGSMVPGAALFRGRPGVDVGSFYHQNSVDEVALTIASDKSYVETGKLSVNGRVHPVGSPLMDPNDPDAFALMVITQRQPVGEGTEAMLFRCSECRHLLFKREYDATPGEAVEGIPFPLFPSQVENVTSIAEFNASHRVCAKCGRENSEFPGELWGAAEYAWRGATANLAYYRLLGAAESLQPA